MTLRFTRRLIEAVIFVYEKSKWVSVRLPDQKTSYGFCFSHKIYRQIGGPLGTKELLNFSSDP